MFNKHIKTKVGVIFSKNGEKFYVLIQMPKYNKQIKKAIDNSNIIVDKKIIVENGGEIIDPYLLIKVPFDFTKSSDTINEYFLEYLELPTYINACLERSIFTEHLLHLIVNNTKYQNEKTINTIAVSQNIFDDYSIRDKFTLLDSVKMFIVNPNRNQEIMDRHKTEYVETMKNMLSTYGLELLKDNPSELRNKIIKTNNVFYRKNPFLSEKYEVIDEKQKEIDDIKITQKAYKTIISNINSIIVTDAINDKNIRNRLREISKKELNNINDQISQKEYLLNVIKHFPE